MKKTLIVIDMQNDFVTDVLLTIAGTSEMVFCCSAIIAL